MSWDDNEVDETKHNTNPTSCNGGVTDSSSGGGDEGNNIETGKEDTPQLTQWRNRDSTNSPAFLSKSWLKRNRKCLLVGGCGLLVLAVTIASSLEQKEVMP